MRNTVRNSKHSQVRSHVLQIPEHKGLYFKDTFNDPEFSAAFQKTVPPTYRNRIFSPIVTLLAFIQQQLSADRSCENAVAQVNLDRISSGLGPASSDNGAYCRARTKLSFQLLYILLQLIASKMEEEAPQEWLWKRRRVKLVDGTLINVADSKENRREFKAQSLGRGNECPFPAVRVLSVFSLATGCVTDVEMGPSVGDFTGEISMFLKLQRNFEPGEVVVGDALYSIYFIFAVLMKRGVDLVIRANLSRPFHILEMKKISKKSHLIITKKTDAREWMSEEHYNQIPDEITLRIVKVTVNQKGFRSKNIILLTTLLDPRFATDQEIGDLYYQRWNAELNLRSLKSTLNMHFIRSKTPAMVKKELMATLIGYNLIRRLMGIAASQHKLKPFQISFKGTLRTLSAYSLLWRCHSMSSELVLNYLVNAISRHRVAKRPGRTSPRTLKYKRGTKYLSSLVKLQKIHG